MLTMNKSSRYHVATTAILQAIPHNQQAGLIAHTAIRSYTKLLEDHCEYIKKYGKDPEYLQDFFLEKQ
jgi:phosphoketolase